MKRTKDIFMEEQQMYPQWWDQEDEMYYEWLNRQHSESSQKHFKGGRLSLNEKNDILSEFASKFFEGLKKNN